MFKTRWAKKSALSVQGRKKREEPLYSAGFDLLVAPCINDVNIIGEEKRKMGDHEKN